MPNYSYYDKNGEKVGPVPFNVVQSLAKQGVITPGTALEMENGQTTIAGSLGGLTFAPTSSHSDSVPSVHHVQHHVQTPNNNIVIAIIVSVFLVAALFVGYTKYEDYRKEQKAKKILQEAGQQFERIGEEFQSNLERMNQVHEEAQRGVEQVMNQSHEGSQSVTTSPLKSATERLKEMEADLNDE